MSRTSFLLRVAGARRPQCGRLPRVFDSPNDSKPEIPRTARPAGTPLHLKGRRKLQCVSLGCCQAPGFAQRAAQRAAQYACHALNAADRNTPRAALRCPRPSGRTATAAPAGSASMRDRSSTTTTTTDPRPVPPATAALPATAGSASSSCCRPSRLRSRCPGQRQPRDGHRGGPRPAKLPQELPHQVRPAAASPRRQRASA